MIGWGPHHLTVGVSHTPPRHDLLFYLRRCWRYRLLPSAGRPEAAAPAGGCFLNAPRERAAAGEGTEPCRRRGWSWSGSPGGGTSPGTRTEGTLTEKTQQAADEILLKFQSKMLKISNTELFHQPCTSFWRISVKTGKSASSKLPTVVGLALQVIRMDRQRDSNR